MSKGIMELTEETKQNFTGIGVYAEPTKRRYIGDYINGKEHGIGMYESRNLTHRYVGEFDKDKAKGIGIKTYFEGKEIYCGQYKDNQRNGIGYWKLPTGAIYVGDHKNHLPHGAGMLITWEGFKFIGFVHNWLAKEGKWYNQNDEEIDITELGYNNDGTKYEGEYKKGKWNGHLKHGQGTYTRPDGSIFEGEFKDDQKNGQGTETYSDGQQYVGEWKDGIKI